MGYDKLKLILNVGPYLAWKLNESTDSLNFSHIWNENHPYNHYEQAIRDIDFGIKLCLGIKYDINAHLGIFIDGRFDAQIAGGRDIFVDRPKGIQVSRLKEFGGSFGIVWNIIPQEKKEIKEGYKPKEDLFETY